MRLFLIGQIDNKESSVTDISAEQSQMFQLWFVFRFVCVSLDFVLWYISFCPLFLFFVAGAGGDTPISPAVMMLALSIVLLLQRAMSERRRSGKESVVM